MIDWSDTIRRGDPPTVERIPWHTGRRLCTCKPPVVNARRVALSAVEVTVVELDVTLAEATHSADCELLR